MKPLNLIKDPWLPVQRRSGVTEWIAPSEINDGIGKDPFVAFAWPRPDFNGAAHELLIGFLSTLAAPNDDDEWNDWWQEPPSPEALQHRFSVASHAFDFDGAEPCFLQDLDPLKDGKAKSVSALLIDAPGADTLRKNADLFVKRQETPVLSRAAAAMALFTLNSYAPSGGAGHRTSLRGGGPLTTLIIVDHRTYGDSLWGRIWPNVETRERIDDRLIEEVRGDDWDAIFPWMSPTRTSNPKAGGRETTPSDVHPLQVYWGMPRRIRLKFEEACDRQCSLTNRDDSMVVTGYTTRNYGVNYSEGFEHPLTPYYRQSAKSTVRLPVHPNPGGLSYRLWPSIALGSKNGLREPASVIRNWLLERGRDMPKPRLLAFGYDMDNMKARSWIEGEMPLWHVDSSALEPLTDLVKQLTDAAASVARLTITSVKSARYESLKQATGDYGFIGERFYRDTEASFYRFVDHAIDSISQDCDSDDTTDARRNWVSEMRVAAMRLFDDYAPSDGLEDRHMHRHVRARFDLELALGGRGKRGKSLFEGDLGISSPEPKRSTAGTKEP